MPRKKTSNTEPDLVFEDEIEEHEDDVRRVGGLDLYDQDGELLEEGEPTYIDDPPEEED